jgi:two-component system, cell cycle sensor histidine kinase and response regulator CckA
MVQLKRTPLHLSVFVVALTAVALLASVLLRPLVEPHFFPLFIVAVLFSAWFYGMSGGVVSTILSTAALLFFFMPPAFSFSIPSLAVAVQLVLFAVTGLLTAWVTAAWRGSRGLLSATLTSIGDAVIATDRAGDITFMNSVAEALTGWRQAEAKRKPLQTVLHLIKEDTREEISGLVPKALRENAAVSMTERAHIISKDATEIAIEHTAAPLRDEDGKVRGVILVFRDVTGRRQLEEQLSHSQKMEAVGRLAGGVAGDFNNLLTVITGYSELLRGEFSINSSLHRFAEEILYAAERAAALTRQLLAFSRGQAAQPKTLDLNSVLTNMEPMLRRLMGANNELIILPDPNLGKIQADPGQIEQVVMNLATNSRDAMPNGGKLVLETANVDLTDAAAGQKVGVPPGSYVMLAVSDTGIGMDNEVRRRLFEPFFTTKEQGKGSGLGLSTVYGIIRQSGGQITVYSQVGCGTIFEVYLPRSTEETEEQPVPTMAPPKGSETVLLVDDEEGVRKLVSAILQSNGYSVIEANNGQAALSSYEKNAHKIDMVLTDVVMPQMDGFELGERLVEKNPEVKILYMSGYRDNPVGTSESQPQQRRPFLHKPFTPDVLLAKVREILDTRAVS